MIEQCTAALEVLYTIEDVLQLTGEHPGNEIDGLDLELLMIKTG